MVYRDQTARKVELSATPQRIVSLVPSQTELLADLGLGDRVVGITKFCIHPSGWKRNKKIVGGTKTLNIQAIQELQPDLIIANKEENEKEQITTLMQHFPVWVSDVKTLEDAIQMIHALGALTDTEDSANKISLQILSGFAELSAHLSSQPAMILPKKAVYLIWNNPLMTVSSDTFIHDMMERCELVNCFATKDAGRYPEISWQQLQEVQPDLVLLSSEPFPFKQSHVAQFEQQLPQAQIMQVDGEMFSWYGSRLSQSARYFNRLIAEINS